MSNKFYSFLSCFALLSTAVLFVSCNQIGSLSSATDKVEDTTQSMYKIWNHPTDSQKNLIIKMDKQGKEGFYVYDVNENLINKHLGLQGIENMALAYGLELQGHKIDVLVVAEKDRNVLRVFRMPDLVPIDVRGIKVFAQLSKQGWHDLALVNLHADKHTNGEQKLYAIVDGKDNTAITYRAQYELIDNGRGSIEAKLVHKSNKEDFVVYTEQNGLEQYMVSNQK